jgi:hypothetical protein
MGNINSQTKAYFDFGATAGGSAGGSRFHGRIKNSKVKDDRSVEVVKAMGVKGGAGHRHKEGGGTITFEIYREDVPTIDFRKLKKDKKLFTCTLQDENNGQRERFYGCTVSSVDRDDDEDGNHIDSLEIKYLSSE